MSVKLTTVDVYKSASTLMDLIGAHVMMALKCPMTDIPVLVSIHVYLYSYTTNHIIIILVPIWFKYERNMHA